MCRVIVVTVVIYQLLCPGKAVFAQDMILKPYEPHSLLLKQENILKINFVAPENNTLLDNYLRSIELYPAKTMVAKIDRPNNTKVDRDVFNALYNKPKVNEKEAIRQEWKEAFGVDVWYPYYKAKDVEKWVKKRFSIKVFKFKGEPEFKKNEILYTLKTKF